MSLQRSNSMGSDASGASGASGNSGFSDASRASNASATGGVVGGDKPDELLEENQSMLKGVFGVLFTLSKEKVDNSRRFVVAKLVLEWIQFLFLILHPSYGWHIDPNLWVWKLVELVNFKNPIVSQGYPFYIGILYTVSVLLVLSIALCIWVGYCFHVQRFPFVWPIQLLRVFVSVFFMVFYIASLGVFLVAINCQWLNGAPYSVAAFPEVECLAMPHMIHMAVAIVLMILFIIITIAATAADFELNPTSPRWLAAATSSVEVRVVMVRTVATLAFSLLPGLRRPETLLIACSVFYAFWLFVRYQPHMVQWINHTRAAIFGSLSWAAFLLLVLTFSGRAFEDVQFSETCTTAMLAGILPFGLLSFGISYLRYRWHYTKALKAFAAAPPDMNIREIWRWQDISAVEMCSRVCRMPDAEDDEKQDETSVRLAERIYKGGMSFFSGKAEMIILYANFMIDVSRQAAAGHSQLVAAKNLKPTIVQQFAIFVREQMHMQAAQTQASGEGSTDLVSYVEFQKHQRLLSRSHKAALIATRSFWRLLMGKEVSFTALSEAFHNIEDSHARADKTYKTVLERYSSSAKVLRMYAHFLEEVKNDPWSAERYLAESEKLEEQQAAAENSALLGGTADGGAVDARNCPVCVINAQGIIQMANKLLLNMYGYRRGELDGKNVSCLMPQPFSGRHNTYMRNYLTTGKAKIIDSMRSVLGLHRERYVFPTRLLVSKVSGDGMDSVFMGVFKPVPEDKAVVNAYVATGGSLLCADLRFLDWFGRNPAELQGKPFHTLGVEQGQLEQLISLASETSEADLNAGKVAVQNVHILHRYSTPVEVDITITLGGTEANRILIYNIRRRQNADLMIASDARGKIVYCTTNMAELLHYEPREMHGLYIRDLIAQPFAQLHSKWMKTSNARIPAGSCRGGSTVVMVDSMGTGVPVRCDINEREIDEKQFHVVSFHRSTFDAGVAQQRLRLKLDPARPGVVTTDFIGVDKHLEETLGEEGEEVMQSTSAGAFGQRQSMYANRHISSFVDVFRAAREKEGGTVASCTELLQKMIAIARARPGVSFRVGVHPPVDEAKLANPAPPASAAAAAASASAEGAAKEGEGGPPAIDVHAMERQMLRRETKPAILRLEIIKIGEGEEAEEEMYLDLYNAVGKMCVIEINKAGIITKPGCCAMHIPGPMFGIMSRAMNTKSIRKFLQLPHGVKVLKTLMTADGKKKKGALKNSHDSKSLGPMKVMDGIHSDGRPMRMEVECIAKDNKQYGAAAGQVAAPSGAGKTRYLLRIRFHKPGHGPKDFPKLIEEMHVNYVEKAASRTAAAMGDDDDSSTEEDDMDESRGPSRGPSRPTSGRRDGGASSHNALAELRAEGLLPGSEPSSPKDDMLALKQGSKISPIKGPGRSSSPPPRGQDDEDDGGGLLADVVRGSPVLGGNRVPSNIVDSARPSLERNGTNQSDLRQGSTTGKAPAFKAQGGARARHASFQLTDQERGRAASPGGEKFQVMRSRVSIDVPRGPAESDDGADGGGGGGGRPRLVERVERGGMEAASDNDDARSASELSGDGASQAVSANAEQEVQNDYRRGKRNKRLQALLSSRKAQAILLRFRNHSLIATLLLLVVHVGCFVALASIVNTPKNYLKELGEAGNGVVHIHSIALWSRVLSSIYANQTAGTFSPPLYSPSDKDKFASMLEDDLNQFELVHHGVYLGFTTLRRLPNSAHADLQTIWESPVQATHIWVDSYQSHEEIQNMTLWQLGNDFVAAGREIMANAAMMSSGNNTISTNRNFFFVIVNGPGSLYFAYKAMLDQLVMRCLDEAQLVKTTLMILLVLEACVLVMAANAYLIHLLSRVGNYRFHIYSIFLVIPTALLRALASKKVTIDGEDDEEEEEEEANAQKQAAAHAQTNKVSDTKGMGTVAISAAKMKDKDRARSDALAIVKQTSGIVGRVRMLLGVAPKAPTSMLSSRKRLVKSPFDSFSLLVPFLLWAVLIIVIYPLSYVTLSNLDTPAAMVNVANFLAFRVRRNIYFVNEACSGADDQQKNATIVSLIARTSDLKKEWASAMFGPSDADRNSEAHFRQASSFTFEGAPEQQVLYRTHSCLRSGAMMYEQPCEPPSSFYYSISRQGVAAMIDRAIEESTAVINDNFASMNLTSPRLDYMWRVGLYDLGDGLDVLREYALALATSKLDTVMTLNVVLLVLSILLAGFFLLFMVQPFLDRARKESRRVAELLSQLPAELNVEKLVQEALVGSGVQGDESRKGTGADGSPHGSGRHDEAVAAGPTAAMAGNKGADADDEDAVKGGAASSDDDDKASVASSG